MHALDIIYQKSIFTGLSIKEDGRKKEKSFQSSRFVFPTRCVQSDAPRNKNATGSGNGGSFLFYFHAAKENIPRALFTAAQREHRGRQDEENEEA